jgi:aminopeptidase N
VNQENAKPYSRGFEEPISSRRFASFALALRLFVLVLFGGLLPGFIPSSIPNAQVKPPPSNRSFDVIHYDVQLELDIANKTLKGTALINFTLLADNLTGIEIDCGDLAIDAVRESGHLLEFVRLQRSLNITLLRSGKTNETRKIEVDYHSAPRRGIRFFPDREQVYTVFSTSQWMVCVDAPEDRSTLNLNLIVPAGLNSVANGRLASKRDQEDKRVSFEWKQETPVPTYTFGFAVGRFRELNEQVDGVQLRYLATQFSDAELRRVFHATADMIQFYTEKSGVRYPYATYTQVLAAGGVEQEMSGFTALRETYGREVLADDHSIWLGAHELAHQWWGNMVTCRDWNHFWLNEGFASFMAAAYKERRFGRAEYMKDIDSYFAGYKKVRDAGKDKSLVFPDWQRPTAEDRTLVYDKGAYVLHLLRTELGEESFWKAVRDYTRKYIAKSVTTQEFQKSVEQSSGRNLREFFAKWVYMTKV